MDPQDRLSLAYLILYSCNRLGISYALAVVDGLAAVHFSRQIVTVSSLIIVWM